MLFLNYVHFAIPAKKARELNISLENICRESMQLGILQLLADSSCGDDLVFKGGTAIHYFYGSSRFSEGLDFALKEEILAPEEFLKKLTSN